MAHDQFEGSNARNLTNYSGVAIQSSVKPKSNTDEDIVKRNITSGGSIARNPEICYGVAIQPSVKPKSNRDEDSLKRNMVSEGSNAIQPFVKPKRNKKKNIASQRSNANQPSVKPKRNKKKNMASKRSNTRNRKSKLSPVKSKKDSRKKDELDDIIDRYEKSVENSMAAEGYEETFDSNDVLADIIDEWVIFEGLSCRLRFKKKWKQMKSPSQIESSYENYQTYKRNKQKFRNSYRIYKLVDESR
ncbi:Uncharacterised protein g4115 [Pycnogonum litorale]